jgi:hypothetical protein
MSTTVDHRVVAFGRIVVAIAATVTVLVIAAICALQGIVWAKTGTWSSLPFWQILDLAGIEVGRTYVTASGGLQPAKRSDLDAFIQWWLEAPAIIPLLVASTVLALFYMGLKSLEEAPPRP